MTTTTPLRDIVCKVVVVGDGAVGKTCILAVYQQGKFPEKYIPTVFENFTSEISIGEKKISLALWDTAGQEDYDQLRPLSYPGTDCFLVCFSLVDRVSLDNIKAKWLPEIRKETGGVFKFLLIGTKTDLRTDEGQLEKLRAKNQQPVTKEEGEKIAQELGAKAYIECSALKNEGIKLIFDKAIKTALFDKATSTQQNSSTPKKSVCSIL